MAIAAVYPVQVDASLEAPLSRWPWLVKWVLVIPHYVVLFGLSMDYNVFVVSRIKEAHDQGMPTREAVSHGVRSTAGVVTSAAVIMVAVFTVFGTLSLQQFKQLSVGLAVAVLIDATVVRGVLLPSVMTVLGDRNWYRPRWLSRRPPGSAPAAGPAPGREAVRHMARG